MTDDALARALAENTRRSEAMVNAQRHARYGSPHDEPEDAPEDALKVDDEPADTTSE